MRTFLIATSKRDKTKYPHPSEFVYTLPIPLTNVVGIAIRDFKFGNETLINENNKTLSLNVNGSSITITLTPGSYGNDISYLLTMINNACSAYHLQFTLDGNNRVVATLTNISTQYIIIQPSPILRILGIESGYGLCLYNPGYLPGSVSPNIIVSQTTYTATNAYDVYNLSEMVIRIKDVETIMSNDPVTDRSTVVLFNSTIDGYTIKQCADHYIPLLQVQHRLQVLRIQLLNMEGDLYDTFNNEAVFLMEFYCQTS